VGGKTDKPTVRGNDGNNNDGREGGEGVNISKDKDTIQFEDEKNKVIARYVIEDEILHFPRETIINMRYLVEIVKQLQDFKNSDMETYMTGA